MALGECCGKKRTSSVADAEGGRANGVSGGGGGGGDKTAAVLVRLWRCLDSRETTSFILLLRSCSTLDAPRPPSASPPHPAACSGAGCGPKETLLVRACCLGATEEVKALLEHGADPNAACGAGHRAVHHCARRGVAGCMRALLADPRTDANAHSPDGYDALHICAYDPSWFIPDKEGRLECIKLLLQHPRFTANKVNIFGQTPLACALLRYYEERVKVMLEFGQNKIDIDWRTFNGRLMRDVIHDKFPALVPLLPQRRLEDPNSKDPNIRLLAHLQQNDVENFQALLEKNTPNLDYFYSDPYYCTIIELACRVPGYGDFVNLLLESGANPNTRNKIDKTPVIHQAAHCCNHQALGILLGTGLVDIRVVNFYNETVLHIATQYISPTEEQQSSMECIVNALLDYKYVQDYFNGGTCFSLDINAQDEGGDTALHNAAYFALNNVVLQLLRRGANMMQRNCSGDPPIKYMSEDTLQAYLDEQIDSNGCSPQSESFEIFFKYDCLFPRATGGEENAFNEMDSMIYLKDSTDLRNLLRHPLMCTFLYLKWHNVKTFYIMNLLMYLLFVLCLTSFALISVDSSISLNMTCVTEEKEDVTSVSESSDIPESENLTRYESPLVLLMTESPRVNTTTCTPMNDYIGNLILLLILALLMVLFVFFLMVREISQLVLLGYKYFLSVENIMELLLIFGTLSLIFVPFLDESSERHVMGLCIMLAWAELVLISGRFPTFSIQLEMFKKVCFTFAKFMAWYSLIIVAFAFSFYILFSGDKPFYSNPGMSIVKTVIMLAGEFEASNLQFSSAPVTSHLVFLAFVFLIAIVLLNLLNGLAVYDTQAIKEDAMVLSLVSMVRVVTYIEDFLKTLIKISKKMNCTKIESHLTKKLIIFDPNLPKKQLHIFPSGGNIKFLLDAEMTTAFEKYQLSQRVIDAAINIIINRNQETELKKLQGAVSEFSAKLNLVEDLIKNIYDAVAK